MFVVALLPDVASAQTGTLTRRRPRLVGSRRARRDRPVVAETTRATVEVITNEQGAYRAGGLVAGACRVETVYSLALQSRT